MAATWKIIQPVIFHDGGQQRGARNNQFNFTCFHDLKPLPDVGDPIHFGGLAATVHLKPGERFTRRVDLRDWYEFDKTGRYELIGTFYLALHGNLDEYRVIWEAYISGPGHVTISGE